jgi:hypothetical protein
MARIGVVVATGAMVAAAIVGLRAAATGRERAADLADHVALADQLRAVTRSFVGAGRGYLLSGSVADQARAKQLERELAGIQQRLVARVRDRDSEVAAELDRELTGIAGAVTHAMLRRPLQPDPRELVEQIAALETDVDARRRSLDATLAGIRDRRRDAMTVAFADAEQLGDRARATTLGVSTLVLLAAAVAVAGRLRRRRVHPTLLPVPNPPRDPPNQPTLLT